MIATTDTTNTRLDFDIFNKCCLHVQNSLPWLRFLYFLNIYIFTFIKLETFTVTL